MITRCPSCGATCSLDVLVQHTEAFALLARVFQKTEVGSAFLKYLALHRPANRALTSDRIAKLLGEIVPDFERGEIKRNGRTCPAPADAWLWAIDEAVKARDAGKLIIPLKGHGWLYSVITSYRADQHALDRSAVEKPKKSNSNRLRAIAGMSPEEADLYIASRLNPFESMSECYHRLIEEQDNTTE